MTAQPEIDLDALEAIAKLANIRSPGPWKNKFHEAIESADGSYVASTWTKTDCTHIAAFDPPTVLALVERARQHEALEKLSAELEAVKAEHAKAEKDAIHYRKTLATQSALIEKAVEALGPIVRAIDACEAADGNLPDEMASLRASFDYFVRYRGADNDEIVERDSVRVSDLRKCRAVSAALTAAIGKGEGT